jgi:mono/diheme cytochrome c family protein
MPGSAMPPWGHLPQEDLRALVEAVRFIAIEGKAQLLGEGGTMSREAALKLAHDILDPGDVVAIPPKPDPAEIAQQRGRELYLSGCASCHDQDGRGRKKQDLKDQSGYAIFARDFTEGIFKGGSDGDLLALRITRGLPGSPMPGTTFTPSDLWSLVAYVQALITPGAQDRVQQVQTVLTATRIRGNVPIEPSDALWTAAGETFLPVMPLWWRSERIEGVSVAALHNDAQIAFRLQWADSTSDTHQLTQSAFGDGVAIQLSPDADPPSFTMGATSDEVSIWYWRASLDTLAGGPSALADVHPLMPSADEDNYPGHPDDDVFMTATAVGNPVSQPRAAVQSLRAGGFGTLTAQRVLSNPVSGQARRVDQSWQVVFVRDLKGDGDIRFKAGETVSIAFAVWDGSAGDRNGQKSVTIWHKLSIEK